MTTMQLLKNHAHIHGFEDYNIVVLRDSCFIPNSWGFHVPYNYDNSTGAYIINKDLPVKAYNDINLTYSWINTVRFTPELVTNHKELLTSAKKVFTHPSCKLSRSMMAEKYKKSLNPYLSDAIIIPKPEYGKFSLKKVALFVNEQSKIIVKVQIKEDNADSLIQNAKEGDRFGYWATCNPDDIYPNKPFKVVDILNAEFFYYGELLYIPNSHSWAMDVLTHQIPVDKIVFEESVQESLGNETNQLDFDSLCSIKDMLESSDENTVSAGLKSLSMMDWMHYTQSIKFILNNVSNKSNWIYNKACSSTSVKYMMKTIAGDYVGRRSRWPGDFDDKIYEEDFELFKKLKCHYHHIQPDDIMAHISSINFIRVNSEGFMVPNIKQRN
jgi:hypothetical protein